MDMKYNREILVNVLVYHRPKQDSSCHCGWAELGRSWPEHIANIYEMDLEAGMDDPVKQYIREELRKKLEEHLAQAPWWCVLCGEGGNYTGERPDAYWVPPADHKCKWL